VSGLNKLQIRYADTKLPYLHDPYQEHPDMYNPKQIDLRLVDAYPCDDLVVSLHLMDLETTNPETLSGNHNCHLSIGQLIELTRLLHKVD
jgi:hypothetical protein